MSEQVIGKAEETLSEDPKELVREGMNKFTIHCQFCPSIIICPATAVFFKEEKVGAYLVIVSAS